MARKKKMILHDHTAGIMARHFMYSKWKNRPFVFPVPVFFTRVTHTVVMKSSALIASPESKREDCFSLAVSSFLRSFSSSLPLVLCCILLSPFCLHSVTILGFWCSAVCFLLASLGGSTRFAAGAAIPRGVWEVYFCCWSSWMLLLFWLKLSTGRSWVPRPSGVLGELVLVVWGGLEVGRRVGGSSRADGVAADARAGGGGGAAVAFSMEAGKRPVNDGWTWLVRRDILCFLLIRGLIKSEFKSRFCNNKKKY